MEKESKYKITHLARRPMVIGGSIEVVCFDAEEADDTLELLQAEEARANAAEAERTAKENEAEEWKSKLRSEQVALGRMEAKVDGVIRERDEAIAHAESRVHRAAYEKECKNRNAYRDERDALRAELDALRAAPLSAGEWKPGDDCYRVREDGCLVKSVVARVVLEMECTAKLDAKLAHRTASAAHLGRADELRKLADEHKSKAKELNKEHGNGE